MNEPEHATLSDGTVLRDLTWRELRGLHWAPDGLGKEINDDLPVAVIIPEDKGGESTLPAGPDYPVTGNA